MPVPSLLQAIRQLDAICSEAIEALEDKDLDVWDVANLVAIFKASNQVLFAIPSLVSEFVSMKPSEFEAIILGFEPVLKKGEKVLELYQAMQHRPRRRTVAEDTVLRPDEMDSD